MLFSHPPTDSFDNFYEEIDNIPESFDEGTFGKHVTSSKKSLKRVQSRETQNPYPPHQSRFPKSTSYNSFADNDPELYHVYGKQVQSYVYGSQFSIGNMPSTGSLTQMPSLNPFSSMPSMHQAMNGQSRFKGKQASAKKKVQGEADFRVKYKTEVCKYWAQKGHCEFGDSCAFAHGKDEIRQKVHISSNYKTKKCNQFHETGYCPYGHRCQFIHNISKDSLSALQSETKPFEEEVEHSEFWHINDPDCMCNKRTRQRLPTFEKHSSEKLSELMDGALKKEDIRSSGFSEEGSAEKKKNNVKTDEETTSKTSSPSKDSPLKTIKEGDYRKYKTSSDEVSSDSSY